MTSQKGRDLLLKIGNGAAPEVFTAIGSARATALALDNNLMDVTPMDAGGKQKLRGGPQAMRLQLDGLFRNQAAEALLRAAAFGQTSNNYQLAFPNGDVYAAPFVVHDYARGGSHDGLETFSVTLQRNGAGTYTAG